MDYEVAMIVAEHITAAIKSLAEPRKENAVLERVFSQDEQTPSGGWARVEAWMLYQDKRLKTCWLDVSGGRFEDDYLKDERLHFDNMAAHRLQRTAIGEFDRLYELVEKEAAKMRAHGSRP